MLIYLTIRSSFYIKIINISDTFILGYKHDPAITERVITTYNIVSCTRDNIFTMAKES